MNGSDEEKKLRHKKTEMKIKVLKRSSVLSYKYLFVKWHAGIFDMNFLASLTLSIQDPVEVRLRILITKNTDHNNHNRKLIFNFKHFADSPSVVDDQGDSFVAS